jgi:hypothetical protein
VEEGVRRAQRLVRVVGRGDGTFQRRMLVDTQAAAEEAAGPVLESAH